ncbi:methyltransferase domain-containing protein [Advenella mimigardefordensis]|uniref:Malonyl-[acyl-carrier protein] O-methyltransferase n=1 Tax=Advenella mimigardefordensis (strain DSM 17166 / LMG 22922 / DPN7) TaxID=1247726 RepID=W0PBP7_ADVMD|nr:methyltransferase domain-containing protein [Advenella mimigardefordensis]AHG62835.1 methyltransferase domain-containing protein [Advenella mimigardefordensis DPN7]
MSQLIHSASRLSINMTHVRQQFARRGLLEDASFFHDEIATRMIDRLGYIKVSPERIVDAGCGPGNSLHLLAARYPQASIIGVDHCAPFIEHCQSQFVSKGLKSIVQKLKGRQGFSFLLADMAAMPIAPESVDMVWSNLALHWHQQPHDVIREWRRVLSNSGLAMFSCLGPGTFREVRSAVAAAGIRTQTMQFVDMHDFGDILLENGFMDPVMDQEVITLTYRTVDALLKDVRGLGGNPSEARGDGLKGRAWYQRLREALEAGRGEDGLLRLSLEVAYGHAWSRPVRQNAAGDTLVPVSSIKRAVR